jgi:hypothetical protein
MKKEPVYQPRGTRNGTAGLKGKTVWVLEVIDGDRTEIGVYTSKPKARYHSQPWIDTCWNIRILERKIR